MRQKDYEFDGYSVFDQEEMIEAYEIFENAEKEYWNTVNFYKKYEFLEGEYPELDFTAEETAATELFLKTNGRIYDKMAKLEEVSAEMILHELNHLVKGHDEEKQKLAKMVYRYYLVNKQNCLAEARVLLDGMIQDPRMEQFSDVLKHALIKMMSMEEKELPSFAFQMK